jgi:putative ABC transport system substrate-binding protein
VGATRAVTQRRAVLGAIAGCWTAWPLASRGVPNAKVHRVGTICAGGGGIDYFWKQFRALGYEEHRNVEYVLKDVDATGDLPGHAAKLVGANVDVIVACSNDEARAATRATSRIPIVLLYGIVPVEAGLVASLARPGGNLTGSAAISTDLAGKSVEIFKSAVPTLRNLSIIVNLTDPVGKILHGATEGTAKQIGLAVATRQVSDEASLSRAFADMSRDRPDGLVVSTSVHDFIPPIIEFAARQRLPAMYPFAPAVRAGGLMAYSPNWLPQSQRNAQIVDLILKGTHPRDIPVEQPVRYSLAINLKTARAMSLAIPRSVLLRATTVIE